MPTPPPPPVNGTLASYVLRHGRQRPDAFPKAADSAATTLRKKKREAVIKTERQMLLLVSRTSILPLKKKEKKILSCDKAKILINIISRWGHFLKKKKKYLSTYRFVFSAPVDHKLLHSNVLRKIFRSGVSNLLGLESATLETFCIISCRPIIIASHS